MMMMMIGDCGAGGQHELAEIEPRLREKFGGDFVWHFWA
jgi:hypothetical protein